MVERNDCCLETLGVGMDRRQQSVMKDDLNVGISRVSPTDNNSNGGDQAAGNVDVRDLADKSYYLNQSGNDSGTLYIPLMSSSTSMEEGGSEKQGDHAQSSKQVMVFQADIAECTGPKCRLPSAQDSDPACPFAAAVDNYNNTNSAGERKETSHNGHSDHTTLAQDQSASSNVEKTHSAVRSTVDLNLAGSECTVVKFADGTSKFIREKTGSRSEVVSYRLEEAEVGPARGPDGSSRLYDPTMPETASKHEHQGVAADQSLSPVYSWQIAVDKQEEYFSSQMMNDEGESCDDELSTFERCQGCNELIISEELVQHAIHCGGKIEGNIGPTMKQQPFEQEKAEFECPECGVGFHTNIDLTIHLQIHQMLAKNAKKMQESNKMMRLVTQAKEEIAKRDPVIPEKGSKCKVCRLRFADRTMKPYHETMHQKFPFHCAKCDLFFDTLLNLRRQRCDAKKHHRVFKYKCRKCKRVLLDAHKMMKHRQKCKGKMEVCGLCKTKFRHFKDLERHVEFCKARVTGDLNGVSDDDKSCADIAEDDVPLQETVRKTGTSLGLEIDKLLVSSQILAGIRENTRCNSPKVNLATVPGESVLHDDNERLKTGDPSHLMPGKTSTSTCRSCGVDLCEAQRHRRSCKKFAKFCKDCLPKQSKKKSKKKSTLSKQSSNPGNGLLHKKTLPPPPLDPPGEVNAHVDIHAPVEKKKKNRKKKEKGLDETCGACGEGFHDFESLAAHAAECNAVMEKKPSEGESCPEATKQLGCELKVDWECPQGQRAQKHRCPKCKSIFWKDRKYRKHLKSCKKHHSQGSSLESVQSTDIAKDRDSSEDDMTLSALQRSQITVEMAKKGDDLSSVRDGPDTASSETSAPSLPRDVHVCATMKTFSTCPVKGREKSKSNSISAASSEDENDKLLKRNDGVPQQMLEMSYENEVNTEACFAMQQMNEKLICKNDATSEDLVTTSHREGKTSNVLGNTEETISPHNVERPSCTAPKYPEVNIKSPICIDDRKKPSAHTEYGQEGTTSPILEHDCTLSSKRDQECAASPQPEVQHVSSTISNQELYSCGEKRGKASNAEMLSSSSKEPEDVIPVFKDSECKVSSPEQKDLSLLKEHASEIPPTYQHCPAITAQESSKSVVAESVQNDAVLVAIQTEPQAIQKNASAEDRIVPGKSDKEDASVSTKLSTEEHSVMSSLEGCIEWTSSKRGASMSQTCDPRSGKENALIEEFSRASRSPSQDMDERPKEVSQRKSDRESQYDSVLPLSVGQKSEFKEDVNTQGKHTSQGNSFVDKADVGVIPPCPVVFNMELEDNDVTDVLPKTGRGVGNVLVTEESSKDSALASGQSYYSDEFVKTEESMVDVELEDASDLMLIDEDVSGHHCVYCAGEFASREDLWEHAKGCRDNHLKDIAGTVENEESAESASVPFTVRSDITGVAVKRVCNAIGVNLSLVGSSGIQAYALVEPVKKKRKRDRRRERRRRCQSSYPLRNVKMSNKATHSLRCDLCGREFQSLSQLERHKVRHVMKHDKKLEVRLQKL